MADRPSAEPVGAPEPPAGPIGGGRFPGCSHTHFLDGNHRRHWADGGETKLSNLVMLCRFHHRQVHEGRVDVRILDDGALRFINARGQPLEAAASMSGDTAGLMCRHRTEGIEINPGTAVTRWCGERLDYGMAVEGLLRQQERAGGNVPAGTLQAPQRHNPSNSSVTTDRGEYHRNPQSGAGEG